MANENSVRDDNRVPAMIVHDTAGTATKRVKLTANLGIPVDVVAGSITADSEFPAAAALADTTANPTTTITATANEVFNGTTWDRMRGNTTGVYVQGAAADNAAATGNPVKVGAKYNSSPPTYADGDVADAQSDVNGNSKITLATLIAGEDLTKDVLKVEQRFTSFSVVADTSVDVGVGFLHSVSISPIAAIPTAGLVTIYDSASETGTVLYSEWVFATTVGHTVILDVNYSTGLYVGIDATLANVRISGSFS